MTVSDLPIHDEDHEFWEEQFGLLQQLPEVWALNADELIRAFELLAQQAEANRQAMARYLKELFQWKNGGANQPRHVPQPKVGGSARMLGGYALETLFKGIAVSLPANKQGLQANDKATARRLFHHELRKLAVEAGVDLTADEALLCERLEQFTVWAGRYPAPKQAKELMPRKLSGKSIVPLTTGSDADFPAILALIKRIRPLLPLFD
ncbi:hypothetical protein OL229_13660 [Neisseriaceae bacterium JH1-16]|nr:hypothetical protein [Neisseriaceae bacterium JH1-16]